MVIAAGIGAVATVGSAVAASSATKKASKAATNAANSNNALQAQIYNQNAATLAPFVQTGTKATGSINALLGIGGDAGAAAKAYQTWQNSTGYQFGLKQGQNSVEAALGAKGLLDSGAALKSLTQFGQDYANSNFQTYLGDLTNQQGVGLTAASAQAGVGQNYANAVSANNNNAATATGNAALTGASIFSNALGGLASDYGFARSMGSSYGGGMGGGVLSGGGNYGLGGIY